MLTKTLPFDESQLRSITQQFPTPFHIYDEKAIRINARRLKNAFKWCDGFREFFAVKATPNPHILKILKDEGFGADCSSLAELILSERVGIRGEEIMFTSNNTPAYEFEKARELGAVINLDDLSHIDYLKEKVGLPDLISFRYNPGQLREGNAIIGKPEEAKYGFTRDQLFQGYQTLKENGVSRFGLHAMVASNELSWEFFVETARMLFGIALDLDKELGINIEFVNIGGGIGIPYSPDQEAVNLELIGQGIQDAYNEMIVANGHPPVKVMMENGRMITGPYGYLVTEVIHKKSTYRDYIGVDACMANLMRPGMYGAYHHITVMGQEGEQPGRAYDVVGSLCENNDKFAIQRPLPKTDIGDLLVVHDTGAHGHSMGFQYNGKLRSAELLLCEDGSVQQIRRAETIDDLFSTLTFD